MNDKNGYVEPFQMFDNVYYVGDKWVSSYAIDTYDGLVIIDTLDSPYSKWVPINLEKPGLEDKPITHILRMGILTMLGALSYFKRCMVLKL